MLPHATHSSFNFLGSSGSGTSSGGRGASLAVGHNRRRWTPVASLMGTGPVTVARQVVVHVGLDSAHGPDALPAGGSHRGRGRTPMPGPGGVGPKLPRSARRRPNARRGLPHHVRACFALRRAKRDCPRIPQDGLLCAMAKVAMERSTAVRRHFAVREDPF